MLEQQYDEKILLSLISIYEEIENEINLFGEDTISEHSQGLIKRRDTVRDMIVRYAQLYCKGFAYAEYMSIEDIKKDITARTI